MNSLKLAVYTSIVLYFARKIVNKGGHRDKPKAHKVTGSYSEESPLDMFQMTSEEITNSLISCLKEEIEREIDKETINCIKVYASKSDIGKGILRCDIRPHVEVDRIRLSTRICGNKVSARILPPDIRAASRAINCIKNHHGRL